MRRTLPLRFDRADVVTELLRPAADDPASRCPQDPELCSQKSARDAARGRAYQRRATSQESPDPRPHAKFGVGVARGPGLWWTEFMEVALRRSPAHVRKRSGRRGRQLALAAGRDGLHEPQDQKTGSLPEVGPNLRPVLAHLRRREGFY